jgi:hypothetical protein
MQKKVNNKRFLNHHIHKIKLVQWINTEGIEFMIIKPVNK